MVNIEKIDKSRNKRVSERGNTRLTIAISLFTTSILASFLIAYLSDSQISYWATATPVAPGVPLEARNLIEVKAKLDKDLRGYLQNDTSPIGFISKESLEPGELIHRAKLSKRNPSFNRELLSISISTADIAPSITPGRLISLYQVHNTQNGEKELAPIQVISDAFLEAITRESGNFGGTLSITIAVRRDEISRVLAATSSGRVVVVSNYE